MLNQFFLTGFCHLLDILMALFYIDQSKPVKLRLSFLSGNVAKPPPSDWSNNKYTWKLWTFHLHPKKISNVWWVVNQHSNHHWKWHFTTRFCSFHRRKHQMLVYLHKVQLQKYQYSDPMESHWNYKEAHPQKKNPKYSKKSMKGVGGGS